MGASVTGRRTSPTLSETIRDQVFDLLAFNVTSSHVGSRAFDLYVTPDNEHEPLMFRQIMSVIAQHLLVRHAFRMATVGFHSKQQLMEERRTDSFLRCDLYSPDVSHFRLPRPRERERERDTERGSRDYWIADE